MSYLSTYLKQIHNALALGYTIGDNEFMGLQREEIIGEFDVALSFLKVVSDDLHNIEQLLVMARLQSRRADCNDYIEQALKIVRSENEYC